MIASETSGRCLAILVKRFPRLSETFILNEISELRRQGIPVKVAAMLDPGEDRVQPESLAEQSAVKYLRSSGGIRGWIGLIPDLLWALLHHPAGVFSAGRFAVARRSLLTARHALEAACLVRWMKKERVVHLHAHFAHGPAATADLARRICGTPYSFTAHAKDLYTTPSWKIAARTRTAAFVVTCTGHNGDYLQELAGQDTAPKIHVIPHGVDLARFGSLRRNPVPGRILSVGRLVPKKGFELLLEALGALHRAGTTFECRIFGEGPLRAKLEDLSRKVGIADRVAFPGARPQTELIGELSEAEIFALSPIVTADGDRDGIPNVLAEAMAAGIPVVATEVSAIPELIRRDETGLLARPDPGDLARAIKTLLHDSSLRSRLGDAGRAFVLQNKGLDRSIQPLAALFQTRLNAPGAGARA